MTYLYDVWTSHVYMLTSMVKYKTQCSSGYVEIIRLLEFRIAEFKDLPVLATKCYVLHN